MWPSLPSARPYSILRASSASNSFHGKAVWPGLLLKASSSMRPPSTGRSSSYESRLIFREPLVAALPRSRKVTAKRIRIADLASERLVIFQRASSPEVFDTIVRVCNDNGFSPRLHNELNNMHSVLSTVEAGEGVAIVPASARNLSGDNISFVRLQPDDVRIDLVAVWRKREPSIALKTFLELLDEELPTIRKKTRYT